MIYFLDVNKFARKLTPVTTSEFFTRSGEFHPNGLFSEDIFGPIESHERKMTYSYINLNVKVIHPSALKLLEQIDRRVTKFISTETSFTLDENNKLQIDENGVTGISEFIKLFPKIEFRDNTNQVKKYTEKLKESYKEGSLFIDKLPVIPVEQRSIYQDNDGNWIYDRLNEYYLSIIRKSFLVKSTQSGPLFDLLNYEVQKAVIEHDSYIRSLIQKKRGIIRSQLLGKRTDFSGRGVITLSTDLKSDEIGIPLKMAIGLFEPFVIHVLLNSGKVNIKNLETEIKKQTGLELSIDTVKQVIKSIKSGDKVSDELHKIFFDATETAMVGRVVLAKRDPALQQESVQAFKPILINGNTIKISCLVVVGFNADFDGDQMAIFHPVTNEAQEDARTKMMKVKTGISSTSTNIKITKEMCVGLYAITKDIKRTTSPVAVTKEDLENATDPYIPVKFRGINTTMGKAIFNNCFPSDFPFYNGLVTGKYVNNLVIEILEKYDEKKTIDIFYKLQTIGFKFATIIAPSFILDDMELPEEILLLKEKLDEASTEEADVLLKKMEDILIKHLKGTGLYDLIESGAAKGWGQPRQLLIAKGIVADPSGNILEPIKSSFSDGLTNEEYFKATSGSRSGIIDRVLNTATTGYMSRKLAFVLNSIEIDRHLKDCKTERTLILKLTKDMISRLTGRYIIKNKKLEIFDPKDYKTGDVINLRSPIYCQSPKLCHICYGKLLEKHKSPYAGVLAAQVIGEIGTQLIMKTFHTGGAVELDNKDMMNDILDNDPLINLTKSSLKEYVRQDENQLTVMKPCILTINLLDYEKDDIQINDDNIWVKSLVSKVEFEDKIFDIILDYSVELQIENIEIVKKEYIKLKYEKGSIILEASIEAQEMKKQINYVERLLGGKEIYKGVTHLLSKLYSVYGPKSNMDLVHLEVLLSQCLRDKQNVSLPARLGKTWDPIMINIKKIVFNTSFLQGLAFENIGEAIKMGLVSEEVPETSIIEKILTGTLTEEA
jgi:DNA-directed RNA polymerase beta' subunit